MHHLSAPASIRLALRLTSLPPDGGGDEAADSAGGRDERKDAPRRIMLVEDEFLIAAVVLEDLRSAGYDVLGPYRTVAAALAAARAEDVEAAVLDINLHGELVYPVAAELRRRGVPFLFLSGYAIANMPRPYRDHPRLAKPAQPAVLLAAVKRMLDAGDA